MLTVRHLNGPLAGTEVKIESRDRVVVGRQLDCDVQYPPEETAVARHHFALARKPSGSWTVELFGTPFVAIDGTPADNGQVVNDGAKVELGRIGGPAFTVAIKEDARTDNYLRTAGQAEAPSPRAIATQASTLARVARAVAAVAVVLALGGAGFAAYNMISARNTTARLENAQKEFADALAREANLRIGADVRAHLSRAVYHVQLQDSEGRLDIGGGTAWVIGPDLLATNGHVAIARDGLRPGERMIVRAPGENGQVYEVIEHNIHPGYVPLKAFVESDRRFRFEYRGLTRQEGLPSNGYDVALLRVKGSLPDNARLTLATPEEINNLSSGTPLGTAGYPVEKMTMRWASAKGTTPELHVGVVTSVTDMFGLPSPASQRQLVHHDLPSTGGQSGSPIVGASGRVVAVLNSGSVLPAVGGGRQPNAALINFGQRADLLRDMLDGTAEKKLVEARAHWQAVTKNFAEAKNFFPQLIIEEAREKLGLDKAARPRLLAEINAGLVANTGERIRRQGKDDAGRPYDFDMYRKYFVSLQKLAPGFDYLFLVMGEGGRIAFNVEIDEKIAATHTDVNYPFIACRLLTPPQQNTGNPKEPRAACATGHHRTDGMRIPQGDTNLRDVELVIFNNRMADDALAGANLKYTLRIYQWAGAERTASPIR